MKFVALALALLLAVGSQAASIQADAPPSQLEHIRSVANVYISQAKDAAVKALDSLEGPEYKDIKDEWTKKLEEVHTNLKNAQAQFSPYTDSVVSTLTEATAEFRSSINADIEALKADLEPKRAALKEVVDKHIEEYRAQLEPIVREYTEQQKKNVEALKTKIEPVVEQLRVKVATNVEETKSKLIPIVESVRSKLSQRFAQILQDVTPYVNEYKEQAKGYVGQVNTMNAEDLTALREKIQPLADDIKTKVQAIFEAVAGSFQKS